MGEPLDVERIHADLVSWGVLEEQAPPTFSRRFRAALARAAAELQAEDAKESPPQGNPVQNQVDAALDAFLKERGEEAGPGHRKFAFAVHVAALPEAVRRLIGV